jgi:2,3-bisphosphoglycerate-independent phosphoglycerate mutase
MRRVLLLFVDGLGLGEAEPAVNPVAAAALPSLRGLLEGRVPVLQSAPYSGAGATLVGLDATLGVAGLPQSGTGQVALLTGANAAARFGRHFGPWVPTALRLFLGEWSVLRRAAAAGLRVAFANAYPEELVAAMRSGAADRARGRFARHAAPPLAALAAGVLVRHTAALVAGEAVASEITNDGWRRQLGRVEVPEVTPAAAGRTLGRIAAAHELTFFAHYATDTAGHRGGMAGAVAALERFDAFVGGVVEAAGQELLVVIASDHGNIEDVRCGHTTNPALGLVVGAGHAEFAEPLRSLLDVTPAILRALGVSDPAAEPPGA